MSINLNQFSVVRAVDVNELLTDDTTKVRFITALGRTSVERREEAEDAERQANARNSAPLQTLARVLRGLSADDVAAIKQQLAAQEAAPEPTKE